LRLNEIYKYDVNIQYTMKKRGAIGLSVNVLVVIIISLVILVGGITLLYKFIGGAEEIKAELDQKTTEELERLLVGQGKKVALPLHVATVQRGDSHVFGIGIMNMKENAETFVIRITLKKVADEGLNDITQQVDQGAVVKWVLYNPAGIQVLPNDHHKESILVNVPKEAVKGQYIYTATVYDSANQVYGNPQKFFVNVI